MSISSRVLIRSVHKQLLIKSPKHDRAKMYHLDIQANVRTGVLLLLGSRADYILKVAVFCGRGRVKPPSTFAKTQLETSKTTLVNRQIHYTIPSSSFATLSVVNLVRVCDGSWWSGWEAMPCHTWRGIGFRRDRSSRCHWHQQVPVREAIPREKYSFLTLFKKPLTPPSF